jgi:hypothetical protein
MKVMVPPAFFAAPERAAEIALAAIGAVALAPLGAASLVLVIAAFWLLTVKEAWIGFDSAPLVPVTVS